MSASPKTTSHLEQPDDELSGSRELSLHGGRTLVVRDRLVELRTESGMLELRIRLTEQGPVLQIEAVKLQLKATESVEIESKRLAIKTEHDTTIEATGEVRVVGKMIHLN
jgi:hypothetical protein